ncbi:MAG: hypothetical protein AB1894_08320 [Chloroflexota bacterium]
MKPERDVHLTPFEREVLNWLLNGDNAVLHALRQQLSCAEIVSREHTGVGFYLSIMVPDRVEELDVDFPMKPNFCFGDVEADIDFLEHGAGFLLWVENGRLSCLEGYTYGDNWPIREVERFQLRYIGGERSLEELRRIWERPLGPSEFTQV